MFFAAADPFLGPEEEELGFVGVELFGDEDGAVDVVAELVEAEGGGGGGFLEVRGVVADPGVGVEGGISEVFDEISVEGLTAGLGDEADLAGGGASVFGGVIGSQDLDFFDGVDVLRAEHGAGGAGAGGDGAIDHDDVFVGAATVDGEASVGNRIGIEGADGAAADTGFEESEINGVAAVEG